MKTKTLAFLFTIGVMLFSTFNCQSNPPSSTDEQIISMLKEFYTAYITENAKMPADFTKINLIKKKYCTANLLSKIEKEELDYDPFLNAQDSNTEWLKTLTIKKDTKENNLFQVSYKDTYSGTQVIIKLIVIKEMESYKINAIL